ncbi:L,D-transpeptidase family protein [Mesorhizobium sp. AR07]|uniref:L,D-transpeptidase family protein n=1 Tax=Mesorhizobium sp. AR07 TaxID=2865838 RepID=UPI00215E4138|nr:L,D-transpeptidase [Mesorhizobium sp. AR07]
MRRGLSLPALTFAASTALGLFPATFVMSSATASSLLTPEAINAAPLDAIPPTYEPPSSQVDPLTTSSTFKVGFAGPSTEFTPPHIGGTPSPSIVRLQVLLDRAGASPGVIDGLDGGNLRHAIAAFETMRGLPVDGKVGPQVIGAIDADKQVIGSYVVTAEDLSTVVGAIPKDYAKMAEMKYLGYARASEALAERFHMDEDFLKSLNPSATFAEGETISVADLGSGKRGKAVRLEVDKAEGQVRAYAEDRSLLAAYPATIGSEETPSPSGTYTVRAVVSNPTYTYNPKLNFKQGNNDKVLTLPPGPNGPVGTVWIELSEPSFGIHGTPEPARIDKTGSHGCVRLTNWDAQGLGKLLSRGVPVQFL